MLSCTYEIPHYTISRIISVSLRFMTFPFWLLNKRFCARNPHNKDSKRIIIKDFVLFWLWRYKVLHSNAIFLGNLFYDLAFKSSSRNNIHLLCTLSSFRPTVYSYNSVRFPRSKAIIFVESTRNEVAIGFN